MSTYLYGAMQKKRKQAEKGTSKEEEPPGISTYLDMLAALVPAEMLALHTFLLGLFTKSRETSEGTITKITDQPALFWSFWALVVGCVALY